MKSMLKNIKYIQKIKAVWCFMRTMPLLLCPVLVSCQNEETIPEQFADEDAVTVRLNLTTRATDPSDDDITGFWGDHLDTWYITSNLFNPPALPRIALMVFNKGQNRYVYSKLVTFQTGIGKGEYQTKIRIPKGESELYAFYAPNRTGWAYGGAPKDVPYYTPEGVLKNNIPWDFSEKEEEDVSMEDIQGSALPAIIDLKNGAPWDEKSIPTLPENNPYDGEHPSPSDEKIIKWLTYDITESAPYGNNMHIGMLSGKTTVTVVPSSGSTVQDITIPLFRDFSRIQIYIAKADQSVKFYLYPKKIAFLNFPVMMSPSFRENDSDKVQLSLSTPNGKNMEYTGVFSYGPRIKEWSYSIHSIPLTAGGEFDYEALRNYNAFIPMCYPQYVAPYLPDTNSWQKKQEHPKILLEVGWCNAVDRPYIDELGSKTWVLDVGEESSPGVYSGPIYPNRDYKVFIVLPESSDKEIIYRVEPWNGKKVDLPPFQ